MGDIYINFSKTLPIQFLFQNNIFYLQSKYSKNKIIYLHGEKIETNK